jgi:hypothetical protein
LRPWGFAAVGSALRGSTNAAAFITERLEVRAVHRGDETDPASDAAREGTQQAIEDIVMAFTEAKLAQPRRLDRLVRRSGHARCARRDRRGSSPATRQ